MGTMRPKKEKQEQEESQSQEEDSYKVYESAEDLVMKIAEEHLDKEVSLEDRVLEVLDPNEASHFIFEVRKESGVNLSHIQQDPGRFVSVAREVQKLREPRAQQYHENWYISEDAAMLAAINGIHPSYLEGSKTIENDEGDEVEHITRSDVLNYRPGPGMTAKASGAVKSAMGKLAFWKGEGEDEEADEGEPIDLKVDEEITEEAVELIEEFALLTGAGVELENINGSGKNGRIVKGDVKKVVDHLLSLGVLEDEEDEEVEKEEAA